MSKRDCYMKFSREEFKMLLNAAKAKGMSHQRAYDAVKNICDQTKPAKFEKVNMHPEMPKLKNNKTKTKEDMIQQFYADIENRY